MAAGHRVLSRHCALGTAPPPAERRARAFGSPSRGRRSLSAPFTPSRSGRSGRAAPSQRSWHSLGRSRSQHVGSSRVALGYVSGRWLVVDCASSGLQPSVIFDLAYSAQPRGALLLPGLAFLRARAAATRAAPVARPSRDGVTRSLGASVRPVSALAASSGGRRTPGAGRAPGVRGMLAWLGALLGGGGARTGCGRCASQSTGSFGPGRATHFLGPFVNRNHFAGYMLLVVPVALALLGEAWRAYARHVGEAASARRRLLGALDTRRDWPAAGHLAAARRNRGARRVHRRAVESSLCRGARARRRGLRSRRGTPAWGAGLVFAAMVLSSLRAGEAQAALCQRSQRLPRRTVIWRESLEHIRGTRWALVTARCSPRRCRAFGRGGCRREPHPGRSRCGGSRERRTRGLSRAEPAGRGLVPGGAQRLRAAAGRNGGPRLAIGLWGAFAALRAARRDPWLFAALAGLLMHEIVDFDLQVPAVAALFSARRADSPEVLRGLMSHPH